MSLHSFDPEVANDVGVNAAVLYQNITFWIAKNEANEKHLYEGRYWMYNSMKAFSRLFIYLSSRQIRTALDKLIESGYIAKGNFNAHLYDRTLWYCDLRQDHLTKKSNGKDGKVQPIPDIKPDIKPDSPLTPKGGEGDIDLIFEKLWKYILGITPSDKKGRHSKPYARRKFKSICTRKVDPISPGKIAHAVQWFYDQEPQKKDEREYMKGLGPVLNGELFANYLDKGRFTRETPEDVNSADWARRANYVNENGGDWPPSSPSPRSMPAKYRSMIKPEYLAKLGIEPKGGNSA